MADGLATKRLSVEQLLEAQSHQPFKGTLEGVEGRPEDVKITPWLPRSGCLCDLSFTIRSSAIEFVTATETRHVCCGKSLRVVEVGFVENATIRIEELFGQISSRAMVAAQRQEMIERAALQAMRNARFQGETNVPFREGSH
jgi:hypothetical protein